MWRVCNFVFGMWCSVVAALVTAGAVGTCVQALTGCNGLAPTLATVALLGTLFRQAEVEGLASETED